MENNDYGLLYDAAVAWKELTEYYYVFTFGYKQQLYTIHLSFPSEKFPHLAGFQYLKDINLPRFNPLMQYICLSICTLLEDENKQEVTDEILEKAYKFTTVNFSHADVVDTMEKGSNQRGQQRKMYETTDGKLLDMYGLVVESLAKNPPLIEISFETFYSRIIQLIKLSANEKNPDKAIVKEHLRKLQNVLEAKEEIYRAIEWKDGKVYVLDPLFLFYLRWGRKNG